MHGLPLLVHGLKWVLYLVGLILWLAYSLLAFLSKPGTRHLAPAVLLAAVIIGFPRLRPVLAAVSAHFDDDTGASGYIVLALVFVVTWGVYVCSSRFLSMFLSIFPMIRRPLRPIPPILAEKKLDQTVPVTIAVAPLPKNRI